MESTTNLPDPRSQVNTSQNQEQTEHADVPNEVATSRPPKGHKKRDTLLIILVLILAAGGFVWYNHQNSSNDHLSNKQPLGSKGKHAESDLTGGIPTRLLQLNQSYNNKYAIGYIHKLAPKEEKLGFSFLTGRAYAATPAYSAAIFYEKDYRIFALDTSTKESTQLTQSGTFNPVFSSVNQQLAYSKSNCDLAILDLVSKQQTIIQQGNKPSDCYRPLAWSPDGQYLAYLDDKELASGASPSTLYLYNKNTHTSEAIAAPGDMDQVGEVLWVSSDGLAVHYYQSSQDNTGYVSVKVYLYHLADNQMTPTMMPSEVVLSTAQTVGNTLFATNNYPLNLLSGPVNGELNTIPGSDNIGSFLVKADGPDKPTTIYSFENHAGNDGTDSAIRLQSMAPTGGARQTLFTAKGNAEYMIGWGKSYDEIIYLSVHANLNTEIHRYTISTNTDEVLLSDVPVAK